jgi:CRP/FNR family transcriptional regulator
MGLVMNIRSAATTALGAVHSPIGPAAPTLMDVFAGRPIESFSAGEALIREGDLAGQIFEVLEGVLRAYKILPDGRRAIMGFVYPGDVLGVSFQRCSLFTAEAATTVKVRRVSRDRFLSLVNKSPGLQSQLFALLSDKMSAAHDQMLLLARKSAEERVASFLLAVHRSSGQGAEIELPMGRLDMADYLGLTIETVSRLMTNFSRRGLIHTTGRHTIVLRKLKILLDIAGRDKDEPDAQARPARRAVWPN